MSIDAKRDERPSLVLTVGALLSTVGVVLMALLCCGVPVLLIATGVLGAAGAVIGSPWMLAIAGIVAVGLLLWLLLRRRSAGSPGTAGDCCAPGINQGPSSRSDASPVTAPPTASDKGAGV